MTENGRHPEAMVFAAPGRYIQGQGALGGLGETLGQMGSRRPLILQDPQVVGLVSDTLDSVEGAARVDFGGECSSTEIDRVAEEARRAGADAIVGLGGGKTLDTAKAVAHPAGLPLVISPTIASTDAPTSALAVIYDDHGAFQEYRFFGRNPDAVIVDTGVVAGAPVRFLVAGMGDALSTYFEAEASSTNRLRTMAGGSPTLAALAIARLCYETLVENGVAAKQDAELGLVTPAVEKIVEANTLLSGLGFESCGIAAAHSIHNGLTALEGTHDYWHGEKVAFGVISMLVLEGKPPEMVEEVAAFCATVGLPVCLEDLGIGDANRDELLEVARAACAPGETIHNEPFEIHPEAVLNAMLAADALGRRLSAV